jgi:hypothetical protein
MTTMEQIKKQIEVHEQSIEQITNNEIKYHKDKIAELILQYQNECKHPKVTSYTGRKRIV